MSSAAKNYLAENGYDVKNGVRPLRRILQETIEEEIADGLLAQRYVPGVTVEVSLKNGKLAYTAVAEKAK